MVANLQDNDLHGLAMSEKDFERLVDEEDIPRYELIDGVAYNMTGSSQNTVTSWTVSLHSSVLTLGARVPARSIRISM